MRLLAPAVALLVALALALGACSGGGPPPAATPEASPAADAPSTPAPTAEASPTPAPAPTPEPPPEQACANGVAVEEPEERPGLVADCVALLASRDALRGEAALDWGADLAIERWEGVAVGGEPPRVVRLDLSGKGLTGSIPRTLRRLRLDEVRLAGNALTGCVPSAFGDARGDALYLGLPWCLRYALDATGEVAEAGEWAVLGADGAVLATWEGLRSEASTLRVHQTDAGGTSWASEFGAVSEGDLFEWWGAIDCWVRYLVTGAPVSPPGGSGRWEFPVERVSYAPTGCAGAIPADATLRAEEQPPPLDEAAVTSPIWHGPFLLSPYGDWSGVWPGLPAPLPGPVTAVDAQDDSWRSSDPAVVQRHPLWRAPDLPDDWRLIAAGADKNMVEAVYGTDRGFLGAEVYIVRYDGNPRHTKFIGGEKAHMIGGYPFVALGPHIAEIFDTSVGILYGAYVHHRTLSPTAVVLSMMPE